MSEALISPFIRRAWDSRVSVPWHIRERDLWDYELLYVKEGEVVVTVNHCTYEGIPGDVFLFKPRQKHSIRSVGAADIRQPHIHFDLLEQADSGGVPISFVPEEEMSPEQKQWFRTDRLSDGPIALPNHMRLKNPAAFEQMLFDLITEFQLKLPYHELQTKGQFIKLLTYLVREHHWSSIPQVSGHLPILLNIQQYLNHHSDCDVTLDALSSMFHISKYYLARLFRSAFGMSPIQYHQTVRLEKAKQLIQFTDMTMQSISERLGFANIHVFSRAFKNKEGVAPSHFRRKRS
ncbi:helix-turn-helix domain-containing protein [Paenibacillus allorhizosphaerae]|uniref:HTH-type transcriptional activator RhaR n=1 Tax=Paenibacillus allorhizosphaerae TaxID=2849866 RepID=A0ABM8VDT6_9BACL|nr:AraC family transcriptional regulator [Paenibacillus allorhizosphaerae]CAG7628695.1 HTH-type transcriptional activator RhaR [Paenibacillus allorhizosphaerae]